MLRKVFVLLFPVGHKGKQRTVSLLLALAVLAGPASAQTPHRVIVPRASRVDLSHSGIHTHANFLLFDTGALDVLAMSRDKAHFPGLRVVGHSRLETDHAALPPDWQTPGEDMPPLDNPYGPIDGRQPGKPGWAVLAWTQNGRHGVKILAPTRFANWVALQPKARRRKYLDGRSYSLEIRWKEMGAGKPEAGA